MPPDTEAGVRTLLLASLLVCDAVTAPAVAAAAAGPPAGATGAGLSTATSSGLSTAAGNSPAELTATASVEPRTPFSGRRVTLVATVTGADQLRTVDWTVETPTRGTVDRTGNRARFRFQTAGTYTVRLTVRDDSGRTARANTTVEMVRTTVRLRGPDGPLSNATLVLDGSGAVGAGVFAVPDDGRVPVLLRRGADYAATTLQDRDRTTPLHPDPGPADGVPDFAVLGRVTAGDDTENDGDDTGRTGDGDDTSRTGDGDDTTEPSPTASPTETESPATTETRTESVTRTESPTRTESVTQTESPTRTRTESPTASERPTESRTPVATERPSQPTATGPDWRSAEWSTAEPATEPRPTPSDPALPVSLRPPAWVPWVTTETPATAVPPVGPSGVPGDEQRPDRSKRRPSDTPRENDADDNPEGRASTVRDGTGRDDGTRGDTADAGGDSGASPTMLSVVATLSLAVGWVIGTRRGRRTGRDDHDSSTDDHDDSDTDGHDERGGKDTGDSR